jgi:hypothetical protein
MPTKLLDMAQAAALVPDGATYSVWGGHRSHTGRYR